MFFTFPLSQKISPVLSVTCLAFLLCPGSYATQGTDYMAPPKYNTVDKFGINVFGDVVTANLNTVSIGGAMGLSHSISLRTNNFDWPGNHGYHDKYAGGLKYAEIGRNTYLVGTGPSGNGGTSYSTLWVMRASFMGDTADFLVTRNGAYQESGFNYTTNYAYEAIGDKRHTLVERGNDRVWTKPDGTEVYFAKGAVASMDAAVTKVIYPNGYTLNVFYHTGVTTNTGFQLKYDYINDDPGLESAKVGINVAGAPSVESSNAAQWRLKNPKYVRAINNAVEYCDPTILAPCALTGNWPKATFTWPGGMPRAIFIANTTFTVENAAGESTNFTYQAQDVGFDVDTQSYISGYAAGSLISPRLISVKPSQATVPTVSYTYKNTFKTMSTGNGSAPYVDDSCLPGIVTSATGMMGTSSYQKPGTDQWGNSTFSGWGISLMRNNFVAIGTLDHISEDFGERTLQLETTYRNFVTKETNKSSPTKNYYYDARNNLNRVVYPTNDGLAVEYSAQYPTTCTNPKTCNKPTWVQDAKGNRTSYTYHDPSGQVATVTSPADKNGKVAVTRYEYTQQSAYYYQPNGVKGYGTPIWLKTAERTCANSATSSNACVGGDEVVTRYEYSENNNLALIGKTITAIGNDGVTPITRRSCYQYDVYGNLIGETKPKANPTSCN